MFDEIAKIFENDQVCHIEPENQSIVKSDLAPDSSYKAKLRQRQLETFDMMYEILSKQFNIKINKFEGIPTDEDTKGLAKAIKYILVDLDPMALACMFRIAQSSKSAAIALCSLYGHLTIDQAVEAARVEENF